MSDRVGGFALAAFAAEASLGALFFAATVGVAFPWFSVESVVLAVLFGRALQPLAAAWGSCVGALVLVPFAISRMPGAELAFLWFPLVVIWAFVLMLPAWASRRLLPPWVPSRKRLWAVAIIAAVATSIVVMYPLFPVVQDLGNVGLPRGLSSAE